jgi:hypothetical protein
MPTRRLHLPRLSGSQYGRKGRAGFNPHRLRIVSLILM